MNHVYMMWLYPGIEEIQDWDNDLGRMFWGES